MGKASRDKGKRGEREAAQALNDLLGCNARRGIQFCGGEDSPDVKHELDGVHFEVKRAERLDLWSALSQAIEDAGPDQAPVVMHRPNRKPWLLVLRLEDLPRLVQSVSNHMVDIADIHTTTYIESEEYDAGL